MKKKKTLQSYLTNAQYLMVRMRPNSGVSSLLKHKGLRIPKSFTSEIVRVNKGLFTTLQKPDHKKAISKAQALFSSPSQIKISLISEEDFASTPALKTARMTSVISRRQDLHNLHFGMIYYAARQRSSSIKGWKIPQLHQIPNHLKNLLTRDANTPSKILFSRISKFKEDKESQLTDNQQDEREKQALQHEYLKRRNYRTSNTLHT
ncbi:MAG: hypothetical protein K0U10_07000 [Gammaproteobacteria bacterium]|nr:hypothetical protein [Chlamydiia bacterium]MCH9690379.1 hypothetical protein [Gammaproteobacteria bacterium]